MSESSMMINGKKCDISKALPLKIGDYRSLINKGVDLKQLETNLIFQFDFLEYIAIKSNSEITAEDFNSLTDNEFKKLANIAQDITAELSHGDTGPLDAG